MNDQDQGVKQGDETNIPDTTPVSEEKIVEEVQVAETEAQSTEQVETEAVEDQTTDAPKKGFTARVQDAVNRANAAEAEAQSLREKIAELTGSVEPKFDFSQTYTPQVEPGAEISQEQYKADVFKTADSIINLRLKQNEAVNRINSETAEVMGTYPELDPKHESFNKDLSESITTAVGEYVLRNPYTASVTKFVEKLMKPYKGAIEKEVGKATENIAKQVSAAALKPTTVNKQEKSASEKSIAELEAELGVVQA